VLGDDANTKPSSLEPTSNVSNKARYVPQIVAPTVNYKIDTSKKPTPKYVPHIVMPTANYKIDTSKKPSFWSDRGKDPNQKEEIVYIKEVVVEEDTVERSNPDFDYTGDYDNQGRRNGKGKLVFRSTGDVYEGEFHDDMFDGHGKLVFGSSGDVFEGQFAEGKIKKGKYIFKEDGGVYDGEFDENGYQHGQGQMKTGNLIFIGKWMDGSKVSGIQEELDTGNRYEGEFLNDQYNGKGEYHWKSTGDVYKGQWRNSQMDGEGELTSAQGTYSGQWKNSVMDGKGSFEFKINDANTKRKHYEGFFKEGKRNGHGVMFYVDGSMYTGEWVDGKREGEGEFQFPPSSSSEDNKEISHQKPSQKGTWHEDKFIGNNNEQSNSSKPSRRKKAN